MNKAKEMREALGLTPTQAGKLFFGYTGKQAYDTFSQWENGTKKPSRPTERFFDVIIMLARAKKDNVRGSSGALDLVIKLLRLKNKGEIK